MGNHEKTKLSKKNKYYISQHRYLELKHFCLQYKEWTEELQSLRFQGGGGEEIHADPQFSDPTAGYALRMVELKKNIEMIRDSAQETDGVLFKYILIAVTEERSYTYLREVMNIPCCKDLFYENYRRFFWILSAMRR